VCTTGKLIACAACWAACLSTSLAGAELRTLDLAAVSEPGLRACFAAVALGQREIDGVPFVITDGRVHVGPGNSRHIDLPATVCGGIHFLHFTEHAGDPVGAYALIYADGERVEVPLRCGINIQDWWKPGILPFAAQAHGDALVYPDHQQPIGFWRLSVRNPRPEMPLAAIEVKDTHALSVISLIAVTLTDTCADRIGGVLTWTSNMDDERFLLAILDQPDTLAGKAQACEQLRYVGSVESVPALEALLGDETLAHAARMALAAMPYPEAGAALRNALATVSGDAKAGIIESLGVRRDTEAVPQIIPALFSHDPKLVLSAALALGKIGGPAAIDALKDFLARRPGNVLEAAALDALLQCAEHLSGTDTRAAHALYAQIRDKWGVGRFRVAAQAGFIRTAGLNAPEVIEASLLTDDPALWEAALPVVRDLKSVIATETFAALLGRVPDGVRPGLVEALAQRGDRAAAPAIARLVSNADPAVRAVAIDALSSMGNGSAVPALVKTAAHGEEPDRAAAAQSLARLSSSDATSALLAQLRQADSAEAEAIAEAFAQRRDTAARPALRGLLSAEDPSVRAAAAIALAEVGTITDAKRLRAFAEGAEEVSDQAAAKRALVRLGERIEVSPEFVRIILAGLEQEDPGLRAILLAVCGRLRNPDLLDALGQATGDDVAEVHDAAVRALADSEDPAALAYLVPLAEGTTEVTHRALAFRGIARLASDTTLEAAVREDALCRALAVAERSDDKRALLGALGACHTARALACAQSQLMDDHVVSEAAIAWAQIANTIGEDRPEGLYDAAKEALARARGAAISPEAIESIAGVVRAAAPPASGDDVRFEHVIVDPAFRSEGIAVADVNRDGLDDIVVGDVWYAAPDWPSREIRPPQVYDPNAGYSQCFACFAMDVDEDGWTDALVVGFPGAPASWYRNPAGAEGHWETRPMAPAAAGETPIFGDLVGDGHPVPVFALNQRITWFRPQADKTLEWQAFPVTQELPEFAQFGHGLGMGDVNGDGRTDLLGTAGWWEAPEDRGRSDWTFHKADLGPACADMVVYDVDGDGDSDVITSSAHEYGVWWFEQRQENGETVFDRHEIHKGISQTHALILADMNSDGLADLVTGKRYYAHNGHDPGAAEPAILCWFELQRPEPGKPQFTYHQIDNHSGVGTQFRVCDLDGDGLFDVVTSNKKGVHAFLQRRSK